MEFTASEIRDQRQKLQLAVSPSISLNFVALKRYRNDPANNIGLIKETEAPLSDEELRVHSRPGSSAAVMEHGFLSK